MRKLFLLLFAHLAICQKCYAPGQGVDISKRIKGATMIVNGAVTYVGEPDEHGIFNATILVRKTWAKKNDDIKDNVVLRLGPFGTDKKCPKVKARMSYIFFIRNSGERKGKYRFYRVQLFPAYASEANLKIAGSILGEKPKDGTMLPMRMEQKSIVHSIAPKAQFNRAGCLELPEPENGSIKCLSNGRQCDFKCRPGYTMVGFHRKVCLGKKGGWKPSKPVLCKGDDSIELAMVDQASKIGGASFLAKTLLQQRNPPQLKLAANNKAIHNSYATVKSTTAKPIVQNLKPSSLRPNLKIAPLHSKNGNSGSKLMSVMQQLARGVNANASQARTTPAAPLHEFFRALNPTNCDVNSGTFRLNNQWNKGFEGVVKVQPSQRITDEWVLVVTFDTPIQNIQLNGRRYVIRKASADKRVYAFKAANYAPIFPQMPLEIGFSADFAGFGTPDATVALHSSCKTTPGNGIVAPARPSEFVRPTRPSFIAQRVTKPYVQTSKPTMKLGRVEDLYSITATIDIPQCSAWQPAGRLPGTGQVFPRWISSVFKSAVRYDYNELLHKSLLFVEAQRSGVLPQDARNIPWRGDSGLKDGCLEQVDLQGGWYHGNDYVKHGLPTAAAATVMLWGLVDYKEAYITTGEYEFGKEQLKWIIDYYMKAHVSKFELYVQVGDVYADNRYWGRAEELDMDRPAKKISTEFPGSDVAAETAAALAAASLVFAEDDETYAAKCLEHARDLWEFALTYQGSYADHIETGEKYKTKVLNDTSYLEEHPETGYMDELVWGAIWLYKATNDYYYLEQAEILFEEAKFYSPRVFSWDDKRAGILVLLAQITGRETYKIALNQFMNWLIESAYRTPKGLVWLDEEGPTRHAANAALIALQAAEVFQDYRTMFTTFAKKQVHYILGDTGRSFVVGYGRNPPQRAYHRGSSCPDVPSPCTWQDRESTKANPQVLFGALVSGPDRLDRYEDSRNEKMNDVAIDYTAAIMTAVAGLKQDTQSSRGFRVLGQWRG